MEAHINLPAIAKILKEGSLEPLKLSQNALDKAINVPAGRIKETIKGTRKLTRHTIFSKYLLFKFFN